MEQNLKDAAQNLRDTTQNLKDAAENLGDATQNLRDAAENLRVAAQQGSIDDLYSLIREDAYIFDKINEIPFVETPLHIAASAGHTRFAIEIMRLKPSFARKLNKDGYSPMHLALQNMKTQLVLLLLDVDEDLVRVQGREGVTPLHYVAQTGDLDLLAKFLKVCPKSIEDVTTQRETVLHIALKNNRLDAFQLVLGWLRRAWFRNATLWEEKLLNWQDEEGNTVLHIAVSQNEPQASSLHSCFLLKRVNSGGCCAKRLLFEQHPF
jgi:ankyrin repeat protein